MHTTQLFIKYFDAHQTINDIYVYYYRYLGVMLECVSPVFVGITRITGVILLTIYIGKFLFHLSTEYFYNYYEFIEDYSL